jgi:glycine dehydrogenase
MKDTFERRHLGNNEAQIEAMLNETGVESVEQLIEQTVPANIFLENDMVLPAPLTEFEYLKLIKEKASRNKVFKSYIGQGFYGTITPAVIRRNIFENPGWYTQYTPYQAEIAQGRLEALLNFQTVVSELTGLPIANASLLDDATAAAEAMNMFFGYKNKRDITSPRFFVDNKVFAQVKDVLITRAEPVGIEIVCGDYHTAELDETYFGALVQYPNSEGSIEDYEHFSASIKKHEIYLAVVADILSLTILTPPGEWGADCVVGNSQRFGVPMGYGGPHAAFFATKDEFKRIIPGRIIGVSQDRHGNYALRMALQTREQHIRRDKATSNICTAQALLAIMAGMYAVYHGEEGLKYIAENTHSNAKKLAIALTGLGYKIKHRAFFDTLTVETDSTAEIRRIAEENNTNFFFTNDAVLISVDETTDENDIHEIVEIFKAAGVSNTGLIVDFDYAENLKRKSSFLQYDVFKKYQTESEMMRYIKKLENKDLSLTHAMIALGSCTMKLNAAVELEPLSWPQFANIHPFAPKNQAAGYQEIISELESYLNVVTGFDATSLQPNSGAQGEYAGLMVIRAYHNSRGDYHRNIVLIPESAHGTNPASAVMAGGKVVVVKCDSHGNIDKDDLKAKAEQYRDTLSSLMITYPSTHGVFEHHIKEIIEAIHENGGQVYMDGANMNAQVGLTSPGTIGADVCHLNLHKTFAIPHGGGGPGMGPICVKSHLAPFLPGNPHVITGGKQAITAVSSAPWGSASILLISYAYIRMLGAAGLKKATQHAILNANYIKARIEKHYDVLYIGKEYGRVAHELIVDFRPFKHSLKIEVEDVAKRLMDYGFHAPTVSFPVAGTLMIEPTESESKEEIDRFCDALISIKNEIDMIASGAFDSEDNPLKNAPHTMHEVCSDQWNHKYTREQAAFPLPYIAERKFWPSVARVNNSYGDRNLICTCAPVSSYAEE